jgi:CheY-like chemotaxis protein
MTGILGMLTLTLDEELDSKIRDNLVTAKSSAEALLTIINDILDISKIEAGKIEIEKQDFGLDQLLREVDSLMALKAGEKPNPIHFAVELDGDVPQILHTDHTRVRQCLINLIGNALKFTDQGHVILRVSSFINKQKGWIRFSVEDTGIGIPVEKLESVFKAFKQADSSTTRKYGGTGLGLTITRKLIHLLEGDISITSQVGEGTTFTIDIPVGVDLSQTPTLTSFDRTSVIQKEDEEQDMQFSGRILVAEDIVVNQKIVRAMLTKVGLEVEIANDGVEAVQMATNNNYDLIFMDIQMPNMNGMEATSILKDKGLRVPIIALTASVMTSEVSTFLDVGCKECLAKPVNRRELYDCLKRYLPIYQTDGHVCFSQ